MDDLKNTIETMFGSVLEDMKIFIKKYGLYVVIGVIVLYFIGKFKEKR